MPLRSTPYPIPRSVIPAGGAISFQMHYTPFGKEIVDNSKIAFYFQDEAPQFIKRQIVIADPSIEIAPNEAREREGLNAVEYGDEPRVQQQVVPLSAAGAIPSSPGPKAPPGMPGTQAPSLNGPQNFDALPPPETPSASMGGFNDSSNFQRDDVQREVRNILRAAQRIGSRRSSA